MIVLVWGSMGNMSVLCTTEHVNTYQNEWAFILIMIDYSLAFLSAVGQYVTVHEVAQGNKLMKEINIGISWHFTTPERPANVKSASKCLDFTALHTYRLVDFLQTSTELVWGPDFTDFNYPQFTFFVVLRPGCQWIIFDSEHARAENTKHTFTSVIGMVVSDFFHRPTIMWKRLIFFSCHGGSVSCSLLFVGGLREQGAYSLCKEWFSSQRKCVQILQIVKCSAVETNLFEVLEATLCKSQFE